MCALQYYTGAQNGVALIIQISSIHGFVVKTFHLTCTDFPLICYNYVRMAVSLGARLSDFSSKTC